MFLYSGGVQRKLFLYAQKSFILPGGERAVFIGRKIDTLRKLGVAVSRVSHYFFMGGEGVVSLTEFIKQFGGAFPCILNPVDVVINAGGNGLNGERGCQEDARIEG